VFEIFLYQPFLNFELLLIIKYTMKVIFISNRSIYNRVPSDESVQKSYFWKFDLFSECIIILTKTFRNQCAPVIL